MPVRTISLEMSVDEKLNIKNKFNKAYQLLNNAVVELQALQEDAQDVHININITTIMPESKTKEL